MKDTNYATGRRKTSIARVWLKSGSGNIVVNNKPINEYFRRQTLELVVRQPLEHIGVLDKFDVQAIVSGGGWSGQAGAMKLAISRCLVEVDEKNKKLLREVGFLTRDARKVERKKPGQKKARKRFQFSKR
ncbi:MAG TPA: 30S ribosomal protein S9 [Spirochaetota bacterium]|nr:30S ribosomal protein S9 [Spirochaetota bacterium]HPI89119.1 30S ribosomal protein S9 [Spirochaetota bacterium]HPR48873.1 30S ribosomal protein S9 [Spirochaetota bacterium]